MLQENVDNRGKVMEELYRQYGELMIKAEILNRKIKTEVIANDSYVAEILHSIKEELEGVKK